VPFGPDPFAMFPGVLAGFGDTASSAATFTARADGAVTDYARSLDGESFVVRTDANRDDPDLAGHRPTEVTPWSASQ
jgi:hypothetical protein